jgi:predicted Zn-dependent protease
MKYIPRLPERNDNVTPRSPLGQFFILAGGLLAIVMAAYFTLGLMVDVIVPRISPELEKKLAGVFMNAVDDSNDTGTGPQTRYCQRLIDKLQQNCSELPYHLTVYVNKNRAVNALALPGGQVVVFTGLLDKVSTENELAFVLAHEMGHYMHRDHLRGVGRALVFMAISTVIFGPDSGVNSFLAQSLNLTELRFSRQQEARADSYALHTLQCAYGHVGAATAFFERIEKEADPGVFGHYFSTHPQNQSRIARLNELIEQHGYIRRNPAPLPEFQ